MKHKLKEIVQHSTQVLQHTQKVTRRICAASLTLVLSVSFMLASATPAAALNSGFSRLAGAVRYDTMSRIVDEYTSLRSSYTGAGNTSIAIVVSGANYPDALAASALAGLADAPIILTETNTLTAQARAQLQKIAPKLTIVIGGEKVITPSVYNAIKSVVVKNSSDYAITRIAGATRYETSLAILNQNVVNLTDNSGNKQPNWSTYTPTVIIASADGFADSLSIGSFAYNRMAPIVLCNPSTGLSDAAIKAISNYGFKNAIIVGGPKAVPSKVEGQLKAISSIGSNVKRLSGNTRYETSIAIAKYEMANVEGFSLNGVVLASGENFPDALAASPLAGLSVSPIVLVSGGSNAASDYFTTMKGASNRAYVVGGNAVVSDSLANTLKSSLGF